MTLFDSKCIAHPQGKHLISPSTCIAIAIVCTLIHCGGLPSRESAGFNPPGIYLYKIKGVELQKQVHFIQGFPSVVGLHCKGLWFYTGLRVYWSPEQFSIFHILQLWLQVLQCAGSLGLASWDAGTITLEEICFEQGAAATTPTVCSILHPHSGRVSAREERLW